MLPAMARASRATLFATVHTLEHQQAALVADLLREEEFVVGHRVGGPRPLRQTGLPVRAGGGTFPDAPPLRRGRPPPVQAGPPSRCGPRAPGGRALPPPPGDTPRPRRPARARTPPAPGPGPPGRPALSVAPA